jgi:tetratricopeptide (TPR) repeat protein
LYHDDDQLDAAEEAASRAMDLFSEEGDQYWICGMHRLLGIICRSRGETEKAIHNFEVALGLASSSDSRNQLHRINMDLAKLYLREGRFDKAQDHVERAKSYAFGHSYHLADVAERQAELWYRQGRFEEARDEGLRAADAYERLGAAEDLKICRRLLQKIESGRTGCQDKRSDGGELLIRKHYAHHTHRIIVSRSEPATHSTP